VSNGALLAHADAVAHTAALGGYAIAGEWDAPAGAAVRWVGAVCQRVLTQDERDAWARDAAVLREAGLGGGWNDKEAGA
jgi:2-keto-4-pentenoate hydratase